MKFRDYVYVILMVFLAMLAYLLFDRGFNLKTKNIVNYQEKTSLIYRVYPFKDSDITKEYLGMNQRYITKTVDKIKFNFSYDSLFSKNVSGYYSYDVIATLYGYTKLENEQVWEKEYKLVDNQVVVLNKNNVKEINISKDDITFDYGNCLNDLNEFAKKYNLNLLGYVEITFNVHENLQFSGIDRVITDEKQAIVKVPLSQDTFKITLNNGKNNIDSYYDFSNKEKINYIFLVFAAISLAFAISFLALIIRNMVLIYHKKYEYRNTLRGILTEHDEKIVRIKRFYNRKKYNLIYVDSFLELLDVYNTVGGPISYREVKKNKEAIFIILDDDSAWIYRLLNKF